MDNDVEDMYRSLPIADQIYLLVKGCYMKMRGAFIGTALVLGLFSFYLAFVIHQPYAALGTGVLAAFLAGLSFAWR